MDFILLATDEDGPGDEETTPLDGEAATPDEEGDKATGTRTEIMMKIPTFDV